MTKNKPLISVIIPCYNQARFLSQVLDSVLAQTYNEIEIIVINDGSPDNIQEVMQPYLANPKIKLHDQLNQGLSAARNTGIRLSQGEYIQFIDSDDWIGPRKFETQIVALEADKSAGLCYCDFYYYYEDTGVLKEMSSNYFGFLEEDPLSVYWIKSIFPPNAILITREWVERVGDFRSDLQVAEDVDYWLRAMAQGCKLLYVPGYQAYYRQHSSSLTKVKAGEELVNSFINIRLHIIQNYPLLAARASELGFEKLLKKLDEKEWALNGLKGELDSAKAQIAQKEADLETLQASYEEHVASADYHYKKLETRFREIESYALNLQKELERYTEKGN